MGINMLHISDLHIGRTNCKETEIRENMLQGLDNYYGGDKFIDYVIVTGDIIDGREKEEQQEQKIERAVQFFHTLIEGINEKQGRHISCREVFFVPGNHDIDGDNGTWDLYQRFLQEFYKDRVPEYYDREMQTTIKICEEEKILFIGLNSNYFSRNYDGKGNNVKAYVDTAQINKVKQLFQDKQGFPNYYTIVFLHHPFYLFTESEGEIGSGVISNAENFAGALAKWNTQLVLHGHKHYQRQSVIKLRGTEKINVFAAASVGKAGVQEHAVNIIEIENNAVEGKKNKLAFFKLIARDRQEFVMEEEPIKELEEGLLYEKIYSEYGNKLKQQDFDFKCVLGILNQLYLLYEPLNLLYQETYLKLLFGGIAYRIAVKNRDAQKKEQLKAEFKDDIEKGLENMAPLCYVLMEELDKNKIALNRETKLELEKTAGKKRAVSFLLLSVFFTDLYFDLKEFWGSEFTVINDLKVNAGRVIRYDFNYGYLFLIIRCNNAGDHKKVRRIVNEYRTFFEKVSGYFSCVKLKIKDIIPEIVSYENDEINFYDFKASVPRLIPLLTGKNIYTSDKVFVRELAQNAIDAISFRERSECSELDGGMLKQIHIDMGQDKEGEFFRIRDYGIGMQKEIIEQYFTTLGKSYYRENDNMKESGIRYNAISNFGIGFLSAFRPCKKIVIKTKHYKERVYHRLEILDQQDYFLIYSGDNNEFQPGTEIICYFKDETHGMEAEEVHDYLEKIMLDIKYPICFLNGLSEIRSRAVRRLNESNRGIIFIPFDEEKGEIGVIENYREILSGDYIEKYRHGMMIRSKIKEDSKDIFVLNAGMLMEETELTDIFSSVDVKLKYNQVFVNFPPNWLDIDISREKATELCFQDMEKIKRKLANSFQIQLRQYREHFKDTPLAVMLEMQEFIEKLCTPKESIVTGINLFINFQEKAIKFQLKEDLEQCEKFSKVKYVYNYESPDGERIHKYLEQAYQENINIEKLSEIRQMLKEGYQPKRDGEKNNISDFLKIVGLYFNEFDPNLPVALAACLSPEEKFTNNRSAADMTRHLIENTILERNTIRNLEDQKEISVPFDEKIQTRFEVATDDLEKIVKNIAGEYGVKAEERSKLDKHDFIWDKIIHDKYRYHYEDITSAEWEKLELEGKQIYENFKAKMKLHMALDENKSRIDVYMIAACYMGSLLKLKIAEMPKNGRTGNLHKYRWILDAAIEIINMWKLSEFKEENSYKYGELKRLREKDNEENYGGRYRKYLQLLSLEEEQGGFKVWLFSELMSWIGFYMEEQLLYKEDFDGMSYGND